MTSVRDTQSLRGDSLHLLSTTHGNTNYAQQTPPAITNKLTDLGDRTRLQRAVRSTLSGREVLAFDKGLFS